MARALSAWTKGDTDETRPAGLLQDSRYKLETEASPAKCRQDRDIERSAVSVCRAFISFDLAPTDDLAERHRDEERVAIGNLLLSIFAKLVQGRRFENVEVSPLARDNVNAVTQTFDVLGRDRRDRDIRKGVHSRSHP